MSNRLISILILLVMTFSDGYDALGQNDADFKSRFEENITNQYQEKVYVHTDRDVYITGETIWLKAYCVDAALHTPSGISKVVNLEVLGLDGNIYKQDRLQLSDGFGSGQLFVSPEMTSGTYTLRACTSWMRNFDPELVFSKQVVVVNPSAPPEVEDTVATSQELNLNFYPEGGSLVTGLNSKVAVKATDHWGGAMRITGVITDDLGQAITDISTSELGYGAFVFAPEEGRQYSASITDNGFTSKFVLPTALPGGLAMSVITNRSGNLDVKISTTTDVEQTVYLVAHSRGIMKLFKKIDLVVKPNISIDKDILDEGITHIAVLGSNFIPFAERLIFKYPEIEPVLELTISQEHYGIRENVMLSLTSNKLGFDGSLASMSASVFRSDDFFIPEDNIVANLLLSSDLPGTLANLSVYMDSENENREEQLDLIMMTHGWRRFNWVSSLLDDNPTTEIKYPAEINSPVLSGQFTGNTEAFKSLQMSFIGRASLFNSTAIGDNGEFEFEVPFRVKNDDVMLMLEHDTLKSADVTLNSPFELRYLPPNLKKRKFKLEQKSYLESLNSNIQISQVYRAYNHINGEDAVEKTLNSHFYGDPDFVYNLDDYTRFETMQDLFIEYVNLVYIRVQNKRSEFHVAGDFLMPGKALVMIDGLPIEDFDFIMAFNPLQVEKIELVNRNYYVGDLTYAGVINLTTYKGDFANQDMPENLLKKAYHAIQSEREFYHPVYTSSGARKERIPDYRNTLYWNPDVTLDKTGSTSIEFFTSDDTGDYTIQINGITNSGKPFYGTGYFKVE